MGRSGCNFSHLITFIVYMTARSFLLSTWFALSCAILFSASLSYVLTQQVLRASANDPQGVLVEDAVSRLSSGDTPGQVVGPRVLDAGHTLLPFIVVYDLSKKPVASGATLDGALPMPPIGVFDQAQKDGIYRVTWQPRPALRFAAVISPYKTGFVLAARSLKDVEVREDSALRLAVGATALALAILLVVAMAFSWRTHL